MSQTQQKQELQEEVKNEFVELFRDPSASDTWLNTENPQLGGEKPGELISSGKAHLVRDLIQSIKYGTMT